MAGWWEGGLGASRAMRVLPAESRSERAAHAGEATRVLRSWMNSMDDDDGSRARAHGAVGCGMANRNADPSGEKMR